MVLIGAKETTPHEIAGSQIVRPRTKRSFKKIAASSRQQSDRLWSGSSEFRRLGRVGEAV